jgi:hypothetical protein
MRARQIGWALAYLLAAGACATVYAPKDASGGYIETWRSPTELEVRFHHNDYLTIEQARELALRRAAELALESGYRYLMTWGERLHEPQIIGAQYAALQVRFVETDEEGALDAVAVVRESEELARGRLSVKARARVTDLDPGSQSP